MVDNTMAPLPPIQEDKIYPMAGAIDVPFAGKALDQRSLQYHVALGDQSPGFEEVKKNLAGGNESGYQDQLVNAEMQKRVDASRGLVKDVIDSGEDIDPLLVASLADVGTPPEKHGLVEGEYVKKVTDMLMDAGDNQEVARILQENPMGLDAKWKGLEDVAWKNLIAQTWKNKLEAQKAQEGWAPWLAQEAMQVLWYPSYANIIGNTPEGAQSSSWWSGTALEEKVNYVYSLPPAEMDKAIRAEVEALSATNVHDAALFVNALVSLSSSDVDMATLNDLSVIPVGWAYHAGMAAKGALKEVKAAGAIAEATRAARKADMASGGLTEAARAAAGEGATGVAEGAGKAATDSPKGPTWDTLTPDYFDNGKTLTLYRGKGNNMGPPGKTAFYTTDPEKAAQYGEVHSVQVTKDEMSHFSQGHGGPDEFVSDNADIANRLKPVNDISNPAANELDAITRAATSATDIETALSGTGKPKQASEYILRSEASEKIAGGNRTVQRQFADMLKRVGSWMNPKVKTNLGDNFHASRLSEMTPMVERLVKDFEEVNRLLNVSRTPEEVFNKAVDLTNAWMEQRYQHLADQVLDVETVLPGASGTGVGQRKWYVGDKGKVPFKTPEEAQAQIHWLGLPADSVGVKPNGNGYVIEVWSNVREDNVFDDVLTPENQMKVTKGGMVSTYLRSWLGSKTQTSEFQSQIRNTAVQSEAKMRTIVDSWYKSYKDLSYREKKALNKIMHQNQIELRDPADPLSRGKYYQNEGELSRAYFRHTKRLPTAAETKAYFDMVHANNLHWLLSNKILYKLKASQGVEQLTLTRMIKEGEMGKTTLEGRIVYPKDFPLSSRPNIDIIFVDESGKIAKVNLKTMSESTQEQLQAAIDGGYHIVQPWNKSSSEVLQFGTTEDPVNFILAPSVEAKPLNLSKQVNFRPGWHTQYKSRWFLKQADIRNGKYHGDISILGFDTKKQLQKWGPAVEKARQLFAEGKLAELDAHIKASKLPFSTDKFTKDIMSRLNKDTPLSYVEHAKKSPDQEFVDGTKWADRYGDIDIESESLFDISQGFVDPFVAKRDPTLFSIKNRGSEDAPLFELAEASFVDPMVSQTKAMGDLIKSEFYNDYQMASANQWLKTFEHNLYIGDHKVTPEEMRRNPVYYLAHGEVRGDAKLVRQAEQTKRAIRELVGQPSQISEDIEYWRHRIITPMVEKYFGEKYLEWIPDTAIGMVTNPVHYLRAIAFHTKLGLMNPVQFFVQGAAVSNVVAMDPVAGMAAFVPSTMFRIARPTEDEKILLEIGARVAKTTPGWTKEMFVDSLKAYRKTGMDDIGSTAFRDHDGAPKLFQSKTIGTILDKGPMFFNAAEKALRATAWNTAYFRYIKKFPNKLGKLNEYDIAKIKDEANAFAGNMTRDANAWWQNNSFTSLFTQFQSYNVRLLEVMTDAKFSRWERGRLIAAQGMLWGFPYGAAVLYAGQYQDPSVLNPWAEDLQIHARNNGIDISDSTINTIYRGLVSATYGGLTGDDYDFGDRYGMSAPRFFDNLKRNLAENDVLPALLITATGPSGSVVNDLWKNSGNVFSGVNDLITGEGTQGNLLPADTEQLLNQFGGPKAWMKLGAATWHAVNGEPMTVRMPNGKQVTDDADPVREAFRTLLGVEDVSITDAYKQLAQDRWDTADKQAVLKQAQKYMGMAMEAWSKGDGETADKMRQYVIAYLAARNFEPAEIHNVIWPGDKYNKDFAESVFRDHTDKIKDIATKSNWYDFLNREYNGEQN